MIITKSQNFANNNVLTIHETFLTQPTISGSQANWSVVAAGGTASNESIISETNHLGIQRLTSGTTTGGTNGARLMINPAATNSSLTQYADSDLILKFVFRTFQTSGAANTANRQILFGAFSGTNVGAANNFGFYVSFNANVITFTMRFDNVTQTTDPIDASTHITENAWHILTIEILPALDGSGNFTVAIGLSAPDSQEMTYFYSLLKNTSSASYNGTTRKGFGASIQTTTDGFNYTLDIDDIFIQKTLW